jgi:hypothetical protein
MAGTQARTAVVTAVEAVGTEGAVGFITANPKAESQPRFPNRRRISRAARSVSASG